MNKQKEKEKDLHKALAEAEPQRIWSLLMRYGNEYRVESFKDLLLATRSIERYLEITGK